MASKQKIFDFNDYAYNEEEAHRLIGRHLKRIAENNKIISVSHSIGHKENTSSRPMYSLYVIAKELKNEQAGQS